MDIARLIERRDELISTLSTRMQDRKIDAATIARSPEIRAERADALKARLEALETAKAAEVARYDRMIADLKDLLDATARAAKADAETFAPLGKETKPDGGKPRRKGKASAR